MRIVTNTCNVYATRVVHRVVYLDGPLPSASPRHKLPPEDESSPSLRDGDLHSRHPRPPLVALEEFFVPHLEVGIVRVPALSRLNKRLTLETFKFMSIQTVILYQ